MENVNRFMPPSHQGSNLRGEKKAVEREQLNLAVQRFEISISICNIRMVGVKRENVKHMVLFIHGI